MNTILSDTPDDEEFQNIDAANSRKYLEKNPVNLRENPHAIQNKFAQFILRTASLYSRKGIDELHLLEGGATFVNNRTDLIAFIAEDGEGKKHVVVANFNSGQLSNYTCYIPN